MNKHKRTMLDFGIFNDLIRLMYHIEPLGEM